MCPKCLRNHSSTGFVPFSAPSPGLTITLVLYVDPESPPPPPPQPGSTGVDELTPSEPQAVFPFFFLVVSRNDRNPFDINQLESDRRTRTVAEQTENGGRVIRLERPGGGRRRGGGGRRRVKPSRNTTVFCFIPFPGLRRNCESEKKAAVSPFQAKYKSC